MAADGSIIIDTKLDTSGFSKVETQSSITIQKLQANLRQLQAQYEAVGIRRKKAFAENNDEKAERLDLQYNKIYDNIEIARKKLELAVKESAERQAKAEQDAAEKTARAATQTARANQKNADAVKRTVKPITQTAKQTERAGSGMGKFSGRLRSIVASAFIFNVLSEGLRKLTDSIWSAISSTDEMQAAISNLKGAAFTAASPLINVLSKALAYLANMAARAFSYISHLYSLLSGKSLSSIAQTAEEMGKVANATGETAKNADKAQKSLAGFDEINVLNSGKKDSGGGGGAELPNYQYNLNSGLPAYVEQVATKIQELIAPLKDINFKPMQTSLKKLGTSFRSFGNTVGKALEWVWENILVPLSEWTIEEAAPEAIELLAAALETVSSVADPVIDGLDEITDDLEPLVNFIKKNVIIELDKWKTRFELVAKTMKDKSPEITQIISNLGTIFSKCWSIIGPVLTKLQNGLEKTNRYINEEFAIGIALVIDVLAGLTEFVVDVFNGDWDEAWADIVGIFDDTKTAIEKSAIALEKATGIQFTKILNNAKTKFTATKNAILKTWEEIEQNGLWATIESKLNSSWENIRTKAKSKFGSVKDEITGAWKDVLDYFKKNDIDLKVIGTNITNAFKDALNKLIMRLNAAIGTPLRNLNSSILKLRKFEIFGAKPFASVPLITVPKIPYLAKGTVIPPGNPYLAVVGDQKRGTNIEAPLSTIEQAVANVLSSQNQNININFVGELAALARVLKPEIDKENVRVGTSLAKGVT